MIKPSVVGIVGSGNVGATLALFLAERNVVSLVKLFDTQVGIGQGKALDICEAAPLRRYKTLVESVESCEQACDADIVVLAAGATRNPGMQRIDLLHANGTIIREIAPMLRDATTVVVVSEPVDLMTTLLVRMTGLPRTAVVGIGTILDSLRLKALIAHTTGLSPDGIATLIVGPHNEDMIVLAPTILGAPLDSVLTRRRFEELVQQTRTAGDDLLQRSKRSTAWYAGAAAACDVVESIAKGLGRLLPVSVVLQGECGIRDVALSVPAIIGPAGIVRVIPPQLNVKQEEALQKAAADMQSVLEGYDA